MSDGRRPRRGGGEEAPEGRRGGRKEELRRGETDENRVRLRTTAMTEETRREETNENVRRMISI